MKPIEAYEKIREVCLRRPDLALKDKYWPSEEIDIQELHKELPKFKGHCYVATYAFCHLIPEASPYTIDRAHFWAQIGDEIWDLTKEQYDYDYPYENGRKLPRKKKLTKRVEALLEEIRES